MAHDDTPSPPTAAVRNTDSRDPFRGAPWWVGFMFKAVSLIGVPVLFLAFYAWRDYKLMDRMTSTLERNAVYLERLAPMLEAKMTTRPKPEDERRNP